MTVVPREAPEPDNPGPGPLAVGEPPSRSGHRKRARLGIWISEPHSLDEIGLQSTPSAAIDLLAISVGLLVLIIIPMRTVAGSTETVILWLASAGMALIPLLTGMLGFYLTTLIALNAASLKPSFINVKASDVPRLKRLMAASALLLGAFAIVSLICVTIAGIRHPDKLGVLLYALPGTTVICVLAAQVGRIGQPSAADKLAYAKKAIVDALELETRLPAKSDTPVWVAGGVPWIAGALVMFGVVMLDRGTTADYAVAISVALMSALIVAAVGAAHLTVQTTPGRTIRIVVWSTTVGYGLVLAGAAAILPTDIDGLAWLGSAIIILTTAFCLAPTRGRLRSLRWLNLSAAIARHSKPRLRRAHARARLSAVRFSMPARAFE